MTQGIFVAHNAAALLSPSAVASSLTSTSHRVEFFIRRRIRSERLVARILKTAHGARESS